MKDMDPGMKMGSGGTLYVGEKGMILDDQILPKSLRDSYKPPTPSIPSSPGHEEEWIRACKGGEAGGSDFSWAGPLTEAVLLGNVVLRPDLKETLSGVVLEWDAEKFSFTNLPEADKFLKTEYRKGWSL
jgi:hypothetical protein